MLGASVSTPKNHHHVSLLCSLSPSFPFRSQPPHKPKSTIITTTTHHNHQNNKTRSISQLTLLFFYIHKQQEYYYLHPPPSLTITITFLFLIVSDWRLVHYVLSFILKLSFKIFYGESSILVRFIINLPHQAS